MTAARHLVFLGLTVTSSWGNGHATNYRALMKALARRGHTVTFLERDVEWYARERDLPQPPYGTTHLYDTIDELREQHADVVRDADLVVLGSYVPDGVDVGEWILSTAQGATAFYDIDTPVTLTSLEQGSCRYLSPRLIPEFDLYLSFTGGPMLDRLRDRWGARQPEAFYCMVDEDAYAPVDTPCRWLLGYLGTYSADRQPTVEALMIEPARELQDHRFVIAGPQYPTAAWPANVHHIEHIPPRDHPSFYSGQRFTLNVTRADMIEAGWSPSVRLFEAAACGVPVISDRWPGIEAFFVPGSEILLARSTEHVVELLRDTGDDLRDRIAAAARSKVLRLHTAAHRAEELEHHLSGVLSGYARR
jgi:spore maturation protein CgeB